MRSGKLSIGQIAASVIFALSLLVTRTRAAAQQFTVLYNFTLNGKDGYSPYGALVFDAAGNLYGTTSAGGYGAACGVVFELSPQADGSWTENVLHLLGSRDDGVVPFASLIFDSSGNLYTTTDSGGMLGDGTVFELMPASGGGWTEKILSVFRSIGYAPIAGVIFDSAGNLYGTTSGGGSYGHGSVFELTPTINVGWTGKMLYSFNGIDGDLPYGGLVFNHAGNLYGTTSGGGAYGAGTVFELTPTAGGGWTEKTAHSFGYGHDGAGPLDGLILDGKGNLYGTTEAGGTHGQFAGQGGTVFELSAAADGNWTEKVLYNFSSDRSDGNQPSAGLLLDTSHNFYGTTWGGGTYGFGTVFELTPTATGGWTEKILHNFSFNGNDGNRPYAGLVSDAAGNLYGTTTGGGANRGGTVFKITP
jgi:uncharacterized repeat protein (TIGR03803 family)